MFGAGPTRFRLSDRWGGCDGRPLPRHVEEVRLSANAGIDRRKTQRQELGLRHDEATKQGS